MRARAADSKVSEVFEGQWSKGRDVPARTQLWVATLVASAGFGSPPHHDALYGGLHAGEETAVFRD